MARPKMFRTLGNYMISAPMCAEAFPAIVQGSKPGPEEKFQLYRYRREGMGKMVYSGPK